MEFVAEVTLTQGTIYIAIFLTYLAISLLFFRWLMPGLNISAKRLTITLWVLQILIVGLALNSNSFAAYDRWLLNLDGEHNLTSALATTQFALVGIVALLAGWSALARPAWQRMYLASIGLLFLVFAWDEFYDLHQLNEHHLVYAALGVVVTSGTIAVALHSPQSERKWHLCFVSGLVISAAGALLLDTIPWDCDRWGPLLIEIDGCLDFWRIEEILEFIGIWLTLVAVCGQFSSLRRSKRRARAFYMLMPLPILLALLPFLATILEYRLASRPVNAQFESRISLEAIEIRTDESGLEIKLFLSSNNWHKYTGLGYSIHLVDCKSGKSISSVDAGASRGDRWRHAVFDSGARYLQRARIQYPLDMQTNRAYGIILTLWREESGKFIPQKVQASDLQMLSDTQIILDEFVLPKPPVSSAEVALAAFDNGFILEAVDLPERALAGETLSIRFTWGAEAQDQEDYIQFLHLGHEETGEWLVYDQQPLGPRLPTRLWYAGLSDSENWEVPLPAGLESGHYSVFTGLYQARDKERVGTRAADGRPFVDARVPLGLLIVQRAV